MPAAGLVRGTLIVPLQVIKHEDVRTHGTVLLWWAEWTGGHFSDDMLFLVEGNFFCRRVKNLTTIITLEMIDTAMAFNYFVRVETSLLKMSIYITRINKIVFLRSRRQSRIRESLCHFSHGLETLMRFCFQILVISMSIEVPETFWLPRQKFRTSRIRESHPSFRKERIMVPQVFLPAKHGQAAVLAKASSCSHYQGRAWFQAVLDCKFSQTIHY